MSSYYDVAWNIPSQKVLYKLVFFTLKMLKLITIIHALILFFKISSDARCMKISRKKKVVGQKLGDQGPLHPHPVINPYIEY